MSEYEGLALHHGHNVEVILRAATSVVTLVCHTCDDDVIQHHTKTTTKTDRYFVEFSYSENPVDIGDWLPQTREHYDSVGPFRIDGKEVDWDTWWNQPNGYANVGNWTSYYMSLVATCPTCKALTDTDEQMYGLDFFEGDPHPTTGVFYTADDLLKSNLTPDTSAYMVDVMQSLIADYESR